MKRFLQNKNKILYIKLYKKKYICRTKRLLKIIMNSILFKITYIK